MSDAIVLAALGDLAQFLPHRTFTKVQQGVIPAMVASDDNVVVAAPTGSGKTLLLEVAMLRLFRKRLLVSGGDDHATSEYRPKAVYVCPIKALANEKYHHWRQLFAGLSVAIETGDQDRERQEQSADGAPVDEALGSVATADIIITTPERWDSITRRWKEKTVLSIVSSVSLLLLDEVHTVHEDRGAALEAVVSRMKAIKAQQQATGKRCAAAHGEHAADRAALPPDSGQVRFVAISGTLPNIEDFAEWLQVKPAMTFSFSAQDRPVPLTIKVVGFASDSNNPFAFDRFLCFKLFGLIRQYSEGKPTIVFCASRKEASGSAQRLVTEIKLQAERHGGDGGLEPSAAVLALANTANDKQLRQCLLLGIAYHHAAMTTTDRCLVEQMFRDQYIAAICTTTTLALGVNLPAHLVIVKGTTFFKSGKRDDTPLSEVAQMCGRAGRPGLDEHGVALVLTTENKVRMYENLIHGNIFTTVESQLHRSMIEHVNAEVALRTIHSFASGLEWIRTTFFWIRLRKCPQHYGLKFASKADELDFQPEVFAERLMGRVLTALNEDECVEIKPYRAADDEEAELWVEGDEHHGRDNDVIESTRVGRNMARMYILFDTVKVFNAEVRRRLDSAGDPALAAGDQDEDADEASALVALDGSAVHAPPLATVPSRRKLFAQGAGPVHLLRRFRLQDVLALCCQSAEFEDIGLRQGDKGPLNEMNKMVKYPVKSGHKGGREVRENWHKSYVLIQGQLSQMTISEVSLRNDFTRLWGVVPRVVRFLCEYARFTGSYSFHACANLLLRCVDQRVWPDGIVLRQLDGITDTVARSLARAGYRNFQCLRDADPRKLEAVCGRLPPFGNQLRSQAKDVPHCRLSLELVSADARGGRKYKVGVDPVPSENDGGATRDAPGDAAAARRRRKQPMSSFLLLVGAPQQDQVLLLRYLPVDLLFAAKTSGTSSRAVGAAFEFVLPLSAATNAKATVEVALVAERWVGGDVTIAVPVFGGTLTVGGSVTSNSNEAGQLSNATALTGSHSIMSFMTKSSVATPSEGLKKKDGGGASGSDAAVKKPVKAKTVVATAAPAAAAPTTAKETPEFLAATVETSRGDFEDLMDDFRYVQGDATNPSRLVSSVQLARRHRATDTPGVTPSSKRVRADLRPTLSRMDISNGGGGGSGEAAFPLSTGQVAPLTAPAPTAHEPVPPAVHGVVRRVNFDFVAPVPGGDAVTLASTPSRPSQQEAAGAVVLGCPHAVTVLKEVRLRHTESPEPRQQEPGPHWQSGPAGMPKDDPHLQAYGGGGGPPHHGGGQYPYGHTGAPYGYQAQYPQYSGAPGPFANQPQAYGYGGHPMNQPQQQYSGQHLDNFYGPPPQQHQPYQQQQQQPVRQRSCRFHFNVGVGGGGAPPPNEAAPRYPPVQQPQYHPQMPPSPQPVNRFMLSNYQSGAAVGYDGAPAAQYGQPFHQNQWGGVPRDELAPPRPPMRASSQLYTQMTQGSYGDPRTPAQQGFHDGRRNSGGASQFSQPQPGAYRAPPPPRTSSIQRSWW